MRLLTLFFMLVLGHLAKAFPAIALADGIAQVHFLPVGQGGCIIIDCPETARQILYDCGSTGGSNAFVALDLEDTVSRARSIMGPNPVGPQLAVVLSHPDADHINRIVPVLDAPNLRGRLQSVWYGGTHDSWSSQPDALHILGTVIRQVVTNGGIVNGTAAPLINLNASDRDLVTAIGSLPNAEAFSPASLQCTAPSLAAGWMPGTVLAVNAGESDNDNSLVLGLSTRQGAALFTGDATGETQQSVVTNARQSSYTITGSALLQVSHHGATTHDSNNTEWANVVRPQTVVSSNGLPMNYSHPRCAALDVYTPYARPLAAGPGAHRYRCFNTRGRTGLVLQEAGQALYTTESNGQITVTVASTGPARVDFGTNGPTERLPDP